jgi:hypothetical protein
MTGGGTCRICTVLCAGLAKGGCARLKEGRRLYDHALSESISRGRLVGWRPAAGMAHFTAEYLGGSRSGAFRLMRQIKWRINRLCAINGLGASATADMSAVFSKQLHL